MTYNPQGTIPCEINRRAGKDFGQVRGEGHRPDFDSARRSNYTQRETNYPKTVLEFPSVFQKGKKGDEDYETNHPTQKPVHLMEYLVRTYSNEGETVLDNTMGSETTGVACVKANGKLASS